MSGSLPGTTAAPRRRGQGTRSWDSGPRTVPRRGQGFFVALGVLALPPGLLAVGLRLFPPRDNTAALLASFVAYGTLAWLVAVLAFGTALLRARSRAVLTVLTALSAALLVLQVSWLAPFFVADDRPATGRPFTLMSLNMLRGEADPAQVRAQARSADVVVLLETTRNALYRLNDQSWRSRFPYRVGDPDSPDSGSAVFSRFPLSDSATLGRTSFQQWVTTAAVPGVGAVTILAVHPCNPFCGGTDWVREHDVVRSEARLHRKGPLVVAGDFNAVDDHAPLRQLHADGLESVTDITGAGWLPTYPADRSFPPLIPIDHVLVNRYLTATSVERFHVDGTDHLGLLTTLAKSA